jgi:hypothetical protein
MIIDTAHGILDMRFWISDCRLPIGETDEDGRRPTALRIADCRLQIGRTAEGLTAEGASVS